MRWDKRQNQYYSKEVQIKWVKNTRRTLNVTEITCNFLSVILRQPVSNWTNLTLDNMNNYTILDNCIIIRLFSIMIKDILIQTIPKILYHSLSFLYIISFFIIPFPSSAVKQTFTRVSTNAFGSRLLIPPSTFLPN